MGYVGYVRCRTDCGFVMLENRRLSSMKLGASLCGSTVRYRTLSLFTARTYRSASSLTE